MSNTHRIALIIDDEEDICLLLKGFLTRSYERVEYANSLTAGMQLAIELKPDILFLDNNLPDGAGISMIADFKKHSSKVIIISAMTNLEEHALKSGADYFLGKPISFKTIRSLIN